MTEDDPTEGEITIAGLTALIEKWDERIRRCAERAARSTDPVFQVSRMRDLAEFTSERDAAIRVLGLIRGDHGGVAPR